MKEESVSVASSTDLGEGHLRLLRKGAVTSNHDHRERNHQGLDNQLAATTATAGEPGQADGFSDGSVWADVAPASFWCYLRHHSVGEESPLSF